MNFRERMSAVLRRQTPDQVPYAFYDHLIPRGDLELELRTRGAGLCLRRSVIWSECPNVDVEIKAERDITTTIYHTPEGDVWTRERTHLGKTSYDTSRLLDGVIKGAQDYDPAIFMIEDTVFHVDESIYSDTALEIGADGIIIVEGLWPPYDETSRYFGYNHGVVNPHQGVVNWVSEQQYHPDQFARLLEALERREERRFRSVLDSPVEIVVLGSLDGHYGPERWREHVLPFYQEYVPRLQAEGKICVLHAHALNLAAYKDVIAQTGVDVVEALTPPPAGDLCLSEAREAWGRDTVIWVNFPEIIFWHGAQATKQYTIDLLRSDSSVSTLVIGFTELGADAIVDDESERVYRAGFRAIMEAIEEHGCYPVG
jgi:hypothetical protein